MLRFLKIFSNRIFVTGILLLIQAAWFFVFLVRLTSYSTIVGIVLSFLSFLIVLFIVQKEDNPAYKIGWIVLIMAFPLFGGLFYLFSGNKRPSRRLRNRLNVQFEKTEPFLAQDLQTIGEIHEMDQRTAGGSTYLHKASGYPIWRNTQSKYYRIGEDMYEDMLVDLEKAEHYIFLEYFIIEHGTMWQGILDILTRKAAEGVDVRLIYDDMGCLNRLPARYPKELEKLGIKCIAFNPFVPFLSLVMNNRDHRKILVIDGHTAFNGGMNLADEYINEIERYGHWKDTGTRLHGEAVWNFTVMFLEMWHVYRDADEDLEQFRPHRFHPEDFISDGYVQPFGDSPLDDEPVGENVYIDILNQAKRYVYMFTPYLVVDNELKSALCNAAKRGVDVRLVTPGISDSAIVSRLAHSNFPVLLEAGIKVFEYTPGFLHAKSFVCDDKLAVVGTINMDYRSLYLHFECGVYLYQASAIMDLKADCLATMEKSKAIQPGDYQYGFFGRLFNAVLWIIAPLL